MGLCVSPNPKCWQSSLLTIHRSLCHSPKPPGAIPSPSHRNLGDSNCALPYRLVYRSAFRGSKNLRTQRVKRACSANSDDFLDEEMMNLIQDVARRLDLPEDDDGDENDKDVVYAVSEDTQNRDKNCDSSEQFRTMKPDLLDPSQLGIQTEPPTWPEREKILRLNFERKVSSVEIPLSIRMIKKKLQWQKGFKEASDFTYCSVKKTFSSTLFIIHELQNYALQIRESLYCEDLRGVMAKLRREMDVSFLWLFQQVFWKTPSLMLYVMVLLANFSVYSMRNNTVIAVTPSSIITEVLPLTENKNKQHPDQDESRKELTEEQMLWNSMLEEASRLQEELRTEALDHETIQQFLAPVSVELEGDEYEEYVRTDLYYKTQLHEEPNNSLLLSNYAQFLYLVVHDFDKAEEYFRRSVVGEPADAEALCRYGDFLWLVRKDTGGAEMRYLQAIDADRGNAHHTSKYATFLWSTGGEDTCYPLELLDNL